MSFDSVGKNWTVDEFKAYLDTLQSPAWARGVCLHHTASPSLAQRPNGLSEQHIENLRDYYKDEKHWQAGPHLFVDDHLIHGLTPLTQRGIHAISFNSSAIGIEVLGDYDSESPVTGRGLLCWLNAAMATKALLDWLGIGVAKDTVLFHRDDPKTEKTCPGELVGKEWVTELIRAA